MGLPASGCQSGGTGERGRDRIEKERKGLGDRRKNVGEQTIFEAISSGYVEPGPYLFLFE
ncbi:hypothetical protein [Methylobacterium pseudosasicola]|uniref:Uncharacterized protein n=1 Tax=Methylobacterium pseudosasicola TaxID=582667 RepID=A0A1I4P6R5_9HYPH|nr:hypothetical protein [Methylobacterium pseudosasicola]SFM23270.1 hypothetical protein SAMN05192568_102371 [Methylobacterium pseudosasicola]